MSRDSAERAHRHVAALARLSYDEVVAAFRKHDTNKNGSIDRDELTHILKGLHGRRWNATMTAELLQEMDQNRSGDIDIDEFVRFIFPRKTGFGGSSRGLSNYEQICEQFRRHDFNKNGYIDQREFTLLMQQLTQTQWSDQDTQTVFEQIDSDRSGQLDVGELVAWLLGVAKPTRQQRRVSNAQLLRKAGEGAQGSPAGKDTAVIVEVVTTRRASGHIGFLDSRWKSIFGDKVVVHGRVEDGGDSAVVKKVGILNSNLVFWNRTSMMAYRDDPFHSSQSRLRFCEELERGSFPNLIRAVSR